MKIDDQAGKDRTTVSYQRSGGSSAAEGAVLAVLGLAATASIIIALVAGATPAKFAKDPMDAVVRYVRSGQVAADLRTMGYMAQYLWDNSPSVATNSPEGNPAVTRQAGTNKPGAAPKV